LFGDTIKSVRRYNLLCKRCVFVAAYCIVTCWCCLCAGLAWTAH